jgi:hypothetical protein
MTLFARNLVALMALSLLHVALPPTARAKASGTVEARFAVLVRGEPSLTANVVDKVPAAGRLKMLGRSTDGEWTQVQARRGRGWVPTNQLKVGLVGEK